MEALFIYIAKASGLIALFYFAYYFLLRKETFFNSNRWFLLIGLTTSALLPFLMFTKTIWLEPSNELKLDDSSTIILPVHESIEINWNIILLSIYILGVLALIGKFVFDFYSLNSILKGKKIKQQADFKFVDINENIAPFSYFEYIVYNSSMYTASELEVIIEHEKVHSDQNHTLDVLISRAFCILFWFNPIIWFYKKAITQNLEFIADKEAAQKLADKKAYQYTLLKITTHESCLSITNHFYQSLIKKRIVMLNANQSKKRNFWKYYTIIPALVTFVFLFQIEVVAQEKPQISEEKKSNVETVDVYKIRKSTTDAELKEIKTKLKKNHNVKFEISEIKRNQSNQLTELILDIKKGSQRAKSVQSSEDHPINEFGVVIITYKNGDKKIGIQTINNSHSTETKTVSTTIKQPKTNTNVKTNHTAVANGNTNTTGVNTKSNTSVNTNTNATVAADVITNTRSNVTISAQSQPNVKILSDKLVLVDGVIVSNMSEDDFQNLNIKTMDVLKGENAIRLFGEKGNKGVILITTKNN